MMYDIKIGATIDLRIREPTDKTDLGLVKKKLELELTSILESAIGKPFKSEDTKEFMKLKVNVKKITKKKEK
jgi:hypothetical protein